MTSQPGSGNLPLHTLQGVKMLPFWTLKYVIIQEENNQLGILKNQARALQKNVGPTLNTVC